MRALRSRTMAWLVWGLIPVTCVGALPRVGCICASGEHKLFCQRAHHGSGDAACCAGRIDSDPSASAPGGRDALPACCARHHKPTDQRPSLQCSQRACRAVVDSLLLWNTGSVPDLSLETDVALAAPDFAGIVAHTEHNVLPNRFENLPPPDLLAVNCTLLI